MNIPVTYSWLAEPYSNIGLSLNNIVYLFEHSLPWTFGALTLRPAWSILGLKGVFLEDQRLPFLPAYGFNTATYLYPFYQDFGWVGILICPFIFGLIVGLVYRQLKKNPTPFVVTSYGFCVMLILFSILDNLFVFMKFWIELGSCYLIFRHASSGSRVASAQAGR